MDMYEIVMKNPVLAILRNVPLEQTLDYAEAITVELAEKALNAGAQFLLTPGAPTDVLEYCAKNNVKLLPGVLTPSEIAASLEYGYKTMKLFPAGAMPLNYVKSLKGPFDQGNYVAIGGA